MAEQYEALKKLEGQRVTFFCLNYIYTGKLVAFDAATATLEDAGIVYETGPFDKQEWQDMQKLPHPVTVMLRTVESFMVLK